VGAAAACDTMPDTVENIAIRPATRADASFLARVMLISGRAHVERGIWEVILGRPEEEVLGFLEHISITDPPHLFHYSCFLIAEANKKSVAALGGYDPEVKGYEKLRTAVERVQAERGYSSQAHEMSQRAEKVLSCLPENIAGAWIIDSVATLPDYRRRGISEKLLERILEIGRMGGHRKTQVNIYVGNLPAQRAYEKMGFSLHEEILCPVFMEKIGSPGMASMTIEHEE